MAKTLYYPNVRRIVEQRLQRLQLDQAGFAKKCCCDETRIAKLESGKFRFKLKTAKKFAEALELPLLEAFTTECPLLSLVKLIFSMDVDDKQLLAVIEAEKALMSQFAKWLVEVLGLEIQKGSVVFLVSVSYPDALRVIQNAKANPAGFRMNLVGSIPALTDHASEPAPWPDGRPEITAFENLSASDKELLRGYAGKLLERHPHLMGRGDLAPLRALVAAVLLRTSFSDPLIKMPDITKGMPLAKVIELLEANEMVSRQRQGGGI